MRRPSPLLFTIVFLLAGVVSSTALRAQESDEGFEARLLRARTLATSGGATKRAQALALYDSMLVASPGNSDVLLARGRTYAWSGRYAEAEADIRAVTAAKPGYADAWSALGDLYVWMDRPRQAADAYGRWVMLEPAAADPLIARGRALRDAGEMVAARTDFSAAAARGADPEEIATLDASTRPQPAAVDAMQIEGYRWLLRIGQELTAFSGGRDSWSDRGVSLRRTFTKGSVALEWLDATRFGNRNAAWSVDGFVSLWSRAYANLRYQHRTTGSALPGEAWRAELFQGIGSGWELSASIDRLRFASGTEYYGIGVGRYVGDWYLRYRLIPGFGSGGWSQRAVIRNYYRGNADDYLAVSIGQGRSADLDRVGVPVRFSNFGVGVNWVRYFPDDWGLRIGAGYDEAVGISEQLLTLSIYRRW